MATKPGETLLHYRLIEKIGEGGMGEVWKAQDTRLRRHVALKFVPEEATTNPKLVERHLREARAASAMNHPHICSIYDIGEWKGRKFIVMELLEGRSLREYILRTPMEVEAAMEFAAQIADALNAAHSKGIIHRDIKPANIMITDGNQVKILDFGLAKLTTGLEQVVAVDAETMPALDKTDPGTVLGTVPYMSPEQALGKELDQRTDIFSLGVVLYEMITGRHPFEGDTSAAVFEAILNKTPTTPARLNPRLPDGFADIVNKALEKDPSLRYQSVSELRTDLTRLQRAAASGKPEAIPVASPFHRRWWLVLAAAAAAAVPLVLLPVLGRISERPDDTGQVPERLMLAVLPFENIGGDPDQEFFADGMTDEMITVLGRASPERLGVIARTSAMRFKKANLPVNAIARELGVGYVIEGSVRRQGNQVRIAATLVQVQDQTQLWSETFNGTVDDIFGLQNSVAQRIGDALAVELPLGVSRKAHTTDPRAYEAFLTGRFLANQATGQSYEKAIAAYERATAIDPAYALVYAHISMEHARRATFGAEHPASFRVKSLEAASEALRLDPDLAETHAALGNIKMYFEWDWEGAENEFQKATTLDPNDGLTYHNYAHLLSALRRSDEAAIMFEKALSLDPLSVDHLICEGGHYVSIGELHRAETSFRKAQELSPDVGVIALYRGWMHEREGRLDEAIAQWERNAGSNRDPYSIATLGYGYGRAGRIDEARAMLAELDEIERGGYVAPMDRAKIFVGLEDFDGAFALLEKEFTNRSAWIFGLILDPGYDPLREDPRFGELLGNLGLTP